MQTMAKGPNDKYNHRRPYDKVQTGDQRHFIDKTWSTGFPGTKDGTTTQRKGKLSIIRVMTTRGPLSRRIDIQITTITADQNNDTMHTPGSIYKNCVFWVKGLECFLNVIAGFLL